MLLRLGYSFLLVALSAGLALSNECPLPPSGTACILSFDPVKCDDDCVYDNLCLAEASGQSNCSGLCADPNPGTACTRELAPVICDDGCVYDSTCLAGAAGQTDCSGVCPTPSSTVACTLELAPVICDGCVYSNNCIAEAAGNTPDNCISLEPATILPACPEPAAETACIFSYQPVECADGCVYDNACLAEAAGQTDCSDACPVSDSTAACTLDYSPAICGDSECLYVNTCRAEAAGQSLDSCTETCPAADPAACAREYVPVLCNGCVFDNECLAKSAGFSAESITALSLTKRSEPKSDTSGGAGLVEVTLASFLAFVAYLII